MSKLPGAAPATDHDEGSTRVLISGLNRTAFDLAVYASQGWSPTHHARLASGCWSGSTGRDWLPAGFHLKGFKLPTILLSRASWREVIPAVWSIVNRTKAKVDPRVQVDFYVFPMNISRLREEYTARGYYQSNEPIWLSAPERLSLQAMTGKVGDRDLMPYFTPSPTAVEGDMMLTQMLQDMERSRYPWIGIFATNPHDRMPLS